MSEERGRNIVSAASHGAQTGRSTTSNMSDLLGPVGEGDSLAFGEAKRYSGVASGSSAHSAVVDDKT